MIGRTTLTKQVMFPDPPIPIPNEIVVHAHNTYVRNIEFDNAGKLYFSEATGAASDGKIYLLSGHSGPTPHAALFCTVPVTSSGGIGFWAGDFTFDQNNNLYLTSGNLVGSNLYKVVGGIPKKVCGPMKDSPSLLGCCAGLDFAPPALNSDIFFANWRRGIFRLVVGSTPGACTQRLWYDGSGIGAERWLSDIAFRPNTSRLVMYFGDGYRSPGAIYQLVHDPDETTPMGVEAPVYTRPTGMLHSMAFDSSDIVYFCDANRFEICKLDSPLPVPVVP